MEHPHKGEAIEIDNSYLGVIGDNLQRLAILG